MSEGHTPSFACMFVYLTARVRHVRTTGTSASWTAACNRGRSFNGRYCGDERGRWPSGRRWRKTTYVEQEASRCTIGYALWNGRPVDVPNFTTVSPSPARKAAGKKTTLGRRKIICVARVNGYAFCCRSMFSITFLCHFFGGRYRHGVVALNRAV